MPPNKATDETVIVRRNEKGVVETVVIYNQVTHQPEIFSVSLYGMDDYKDLLNK